MLHNLIESNTVANGTDRRGRLMAMSFMAVTATLTAAWTFSLFSKGLGTVGGDLDLSALVAPVELVASTPPAPMPKAASQPRKATAQKKVVLPEFYEPVGKTAPQMTFSQANVVDASKFDPGLLERGPESIPADAGATGTGTGTGGATSGTGTGETAVETEVVKPPVKPEEPKVPKIVSGGVVNGRAVDLVKPVYSAMAKAVQARGNVNVQVVIDEDGKVVSAKAVDGHPLLRDAAERAARSSRFTPTKLSDQPVKVSGTIVYRFTA